MPQFKLPQKGDTLTTGFFREVADLHNKLAGKTAAAGMPSAHPAMMACYPFMGKVTLVNIESDNSLSYDVQELLLSRDETSGLPIQTPDAQTCDHLCKTQAYASSPLDVFAVDNVVWVVLDPQTSVYTIISRGPTLVYAKVTALLSSGTPLICSGVTANPVDNTGTADTSKTLTLLTRLSTGLQTIAPFLAVGDIVAYMPITSGYAGIGTADGVLKGDVMIPTKTVDGVSPAVNSGHSLVIGKDAGGTLPQISLDYPRWQAISP